MRFSRDIALFGATFAANPCARTHDFNKNQKICDGCMKAIDVGQAILEFAKLQDESLNLNSLPEDSDMFKTFLRFLMRRTF